MDENLKRFWAKVDKNGPVVRPDLGNCWVWSAALRSGYGAFSIKHKAVAAHKWIYESENGPVQGLLRHKCDNRACVRLSHLEVGTHRDNARDMMERNPNIYNLTTDQVVLARTLAAGGQSMNTIHKTIGGDRQTILNAIVGKTFSHLIDPPPVEFKDVYRPVYNKLSEQDYEEILEALKKPYHGQGKKLAEKYGVDPAMITLIKQGKLKTIRGASHGLPNTQLI